VNASNRLSISCKAIAEIELELELELELEAETGIDSKSDRLPKTTSALKTKGAAVQARRILQLSFIFCSQISATN
jgi:hypothetical protein